MKEKKLIFFYAFLADAANPERQKFALPHDVLEIVLLEFISKAYLLHEIVQNGMNTRAFAFKLLNGAIDSKDFRQTVEDIVIFSYIPAASLRKSFLTKLLLIKRIHDYLTQDNIRLIYNFAASNGYLDILKYIWINFNEDVRQLSNNITMSRYFLFSLNLFDYAAENGHLETIAWLQENGFNGCTIDSVNWSAENGHLETVVWLNKNRKVTCTRDAMDLAAGNGHLEVVKWLHENRTDGCSTNAMDWAARGGHLETIVWLHENRYEGCTEWAMNYAAAKGYLDIVKYFCMNTNTKRHVLSAR